MHSKLNNASLRAQKNTTVKLSLNDSIDLVKAEDWDTVVGDQNIYLTRSYLGALEKALESDIDFRYTIFYNDRLIPMAVSYIQIMQFADTGSTYKESFCYIGDKIKNKLIGSIDARVLICGNVFACGENGFAYTSDLTPKEAHSILSQSMKRLSEEKDANGQVSFGLLKEFWPHSFQHSDNLAEHNYKGFEIYVNMVMNIPSEWNAFEDYLNDMTTKFRTKAKGVLKKSSPIEVRGLNLDEIIENSKRIEELYLNVLAKADFKFGELNAQAFINFKQNLKEKFILTGYFLNEKMVGFSSAFLCEGKGDANYVGLDYEFNKDYALYQRMLYDFVDLAIREKLSVLRLGRTSELLKSSIGAEPVPMKLYLRHRNSISNSLIGPLIASISPSEFELRPPFKKALS